jgi:hypothetical protein
VLAREVSGGIVVPADTTAHLSWTADGGGGRVTPATSSATASRQAWPALAATLNAALPAIQAGAPVEPVVTVATETAATAADFRFVAPRSCCCRSDRRRRRRARGAGRRPGSTVGRRRPDGDRRAAFVALAAVATPLSSVDVALFTWHLDIDAVGLFAFLWSR